MRLLLALVLTLPVLQAQLKDCSVSATGYKVLLDDVIYDGPTLGGAQATQLMSRLRMKLTSDLEALRVQTQLPLAVVRCEGRRPNDANDFKLSLVDALNTRGVLLELWGTVAQNGATADTMIGFALIPVRFYEKASEELPGVYFARYETKGADAGSVLNLLSQSRELRAFVMIAGGTKAMRERRYNEAYRSLCDAADLVAKVKAEGAAPLAKYAQRAAFETLTRARQDAVYQGTLKLLTAQDASAACKGGR